MSKLNPCRPDCPDRAVGCQAKCEKMLAAKELQATEIAAEEQMAAAGRMVDQRAAERSAAIKWPLSERELALIAAMDKGEYHE